MSNAEDTTTSYILKQHGHEDKTLERHLLNYWVKKCRKDAKAHTNQTLQELKEKVLDRINMIKDFDNNHSKSRLTAFREVKTLIDEAINE